MTEKRAPTEDVRRRRIEEDILASKNAIQAMQNRIYDLKEELNTTTPIMTRLALETLTEVFFLVTKLKSQRWEAGIRGYLQLGYLKMLRENVTFFGEYRNVGTNRFQRRHGWGVGLRAICRRLVVALASSSPSPSGVSYRVDSILTNTGKWLGPTKTPNFDREPPTGTGEILSQRGICMILTSDILQMAPRTVHGHE
ncbi:unnamed protein product [Cyclocybe aegerita]|uniref:Uncharacterized protein n=1 Tax=Cyclocybe aegerita TaxID=1973307 RepID=A0A8S0WUY2_CYCAE|nr:unnamed protein product [Cyclocybe aegerita]